jgi:N-acetyl-anhydromuramyl-L-alanine amidase AmpD
MQISEVHDYARQLLKVHGAKARVVAAQKAIESEKRGDSQEAEDWRRIRDALAEMRGPHVS